MWQNPDPRQASDNSPHDSPAAPNRDPVLPDIVDKARKRECQIAEALRVQAEADARLQRALDAWHAVASFRGDRIPRGLTGKVLWRSYAERIVALGQVLKADGWQARLDAVQSGSQAKTFAVEFLRRAMNADQAAVESMVSDAMDTLFSLGLGANRWLREGLMYEVLGVSQPLEPPPGWEGPYNCPVEPAQDMIHWLEWRFLVQEPRSQERGHEPSDGCLVRNAYRLAEQIGLPNVSLEPLGPFTLHQELVVLRNFRRLCRAAFGACNGADGGVEAPPPAAPSDGDSAGLSTPNGATAEQKIAALLSGNPGTGLKEAIDATGLSEWRILRTQAWKERDEALLGGYLRQHPDATARDVQQALGHSPSKTSRMQAWRNHQGRKKAKTPSRPIGERPFTDQTLACCVDEHSQRAKLQMENRDQLFREILESATAPTRGRLNKLSDVERVALLDFVVATLEETLEEKDPAAARATLATYVESWVDQHEEDTRFEHSRRRRG
jgi:hypothetical protein